MPNITSFSPIAATPGQKVTIQGTGFIGTTAVKFGGVDALVFFIVGDTTIEAYPNLEGTGTVSVFNSSSNDTAVNFTLILTKVRITDLPPLNRVATEDDLVYVFDVIRNILCQSPVSNLPAGSGGGGGGGTIPTALGSPFKVRVDDDNFQYFPNTVDPTLPGKVVITDLRLLGKTDYVVSSTDVNGEFENERLVFNETDGSVTINDYELSAGRHVTIYADGTVSAAIQAYLISVKSDIDSFRKVLQPALVPGGIVWPWRKPAIDIPDGWQEATDLRGKTLIGQDPLDTWNATTNPTGLSRAVGTQVGNKTVTLTKENIPELETENIFDASGGTAVDSFRAAKSGTKRTVKVNPKGFLPDGVTPVPTTPTSLLNPARIVQWIEYIG